MRPLFLIGALASVLFLSTSPVTGEPPRLDGGADGPAAGLPSLALRSADLFREDPASVSPREAGGSDWTIEAMPSPLGGMGALPSASLGASSSAAVKSYLEARLGPLFFLDDFDNLDVGFLAEGAFGARPIPLLALEVTGGYLRGEDPGNETLWAVPIMGNVKVTIPLPLVKPYVGGGVGVFYLNTEEKTALGDVDETDWVLGWNAMVGVSFEVGPLMVGAEAKYLQTEEAKTARSVDTRLEGIAVLAAVGVKF